MAQPGGLPDCRAGLVEAERGIALPCAHARRGAAPAASARASRWDGGCRCRAAFDRRAPAPGAASVAGAQAEGAAARRTHCIARRGFDDGDGILAAEMPGRRTVGAVGDALARAGPSRGAASLRAGRPAASRVMTTVHLGLTDVALAAVLVLANAVASIVLQLRLHRQVLWAATRMVVQLLLVGLLLRIVF